MRFVVVFLLLSACSEPALAPSPSAPAPETPAPLPTEEDPPPPEPTKPEPSYLLSHKLLGRFSKLSLLPFLMPGVTIDNGYSVYEIQYISQNQTLTATVKLPNIPTPEGGFHIVVNNHGTTGVADICSITGTSWASGLAGELGARGLIGVTPEYEGLGGPGVHPYLVSKSEGRSALDAIHAVEELGLALDWELSHRYAVVGLSQGGHAALGAASEHATYAPELDIRAFAAAAPASVRAEEWKDTVLIPGEHIVYHALVVYAWTQVYGGPSPLLVDTAVFENACAFSPFTSTPLLKDLLPHEPTELFAADFLDAYATGDFSAYPTIGAAFAENRVKPFTQTAPLRIYQGDADTTVLEASTAAMVSDLRAAGMEVDYVVVPGGEHTTVAFSFVAQKQQSTSDSIAWLKQQLDR